MKIRNITEYLQNRNFKEDLSLLGTNDEPFLVRLQGDEPNVNTIIEGNASFAQNAQEQLFYEFVQNAYDAHAEDLFFFADEDYLVILNNGKPFYTDTLTMQSGKYKEGQLYNFLAKGKSQKHGDDSKMGNYGQGSKLLYTLLCDVGDMRTNEQQLTQKIKIEKKGPYMLSWATRNQLDNILSGRRSWEYSDPNDVDAAPLICKIVMGYYPVMPGRDQSLLPDAEMEAAICGFERLVDPKRSINRLRQGTALIVPLGRGQLQRITDSDNLNKVELGLKGFTSLISSSDTYAGAVTRCIEMFGRNITPVKAPSMTLDVDVDSNTKQRYSFVFSPKFAKERYVSLYKWLPITMARYGLGFLTDSRQFDIDDSRQRITDPAKVSVQLLAAYRKVMEEVTTLKETDVEKFTAIYNAVAASDIPEAEEYKFVREPFGEVFIPFLRDNVLAVDGSWHPVAQIYSRKNIKMNFIDLHSLGINSRYWIDPLLEEDYKRLGIKVYAPNPQEIVESAMLDKLKEFVKGLSMTQYAEWHKYFAESMEGSVSLKALPLLRTNMGNVVSYNEVALVQSKVLFFDNTVINESPVYTSVEGLEYVAGPLPSVSDALWKSLYKKVQVHIEMFRSSNAFTQCAAAILVNLNRNKSVSLSEVHDIQLLANEKGAYCAFKSLFRKRPGDVIILDSFRVNGAVPEEIPDNWFVNTPVERWKWIVENLSSIQALGDWGELTPRYLADLKTLYKGASDSLTATRPEGIPLSIGDDGCPVHESSQFLKGKHLEEDYEIIRETFAKSCRIIPYKYADMMSNPAFDYSRRTIGVEDLIESTATYSIRQVRAFLNSSPDLLNRFWIEQCEDAYKFHKSGNARARYNFIISASYGFLTEIRTTLAEAGYHEIPQQVQTLMKNASAYDIATNIEEALGQCADVTSLFPIVRTQNDKVKQMYFDKLPIQNIDSKIEEDSLLWAVITYVIKNYEEYGAFLRQKIYIKGKPMPESLQASVVKVGDRLYDLYRLLPGVKECNSIVKSLEEYLPNADAFRAKFFATEESPSAADVYAKVNKDQLSVYQLEFCLDCSLNINEQRAFQEHALRLAQSAALQEALDMVSVRAFKDFDRFWVISGFDKSSQVMADDSLLLPEEKLPEALYDWLKADAGRCGFIDGLMDGSNPYIRLRKALKHGGAYVSGLTIANADTLLLPTISWILSETGEVVEESDRFRLLKDFINRLPQDVSTVIGMRYTGKCVNSAERTSNPDEINSHRALFEVIEIDLECALLNADNVEGFASLLNGCQRLADCVASNRLLYPVYFDSLELPVWSVSRQMELKGDEVVWNEPIYRKWKDKCGTSVYISGHPVPTSLTVTCGERVIFSDTQEAGVDFGGNEWKKYVVVCSKTHSVDVILNILKKVANNMHWFRSDFIELQAMRIDTFETLRREAEAKGTSLEALVAAAGVGSAVQGSSAMDQTPGGAYSLCLPESMSEQFAQQLLDSVADDQTAGVMLNILTIFTPDELLQMSQNPELVSDALINPEEPESKVRRIIGYIGELIFKEYLEKHLDVSYEFSADRGEGRYDFVMHSDKDESERLYVDVKTNLYSFEDGNYPFHLHRSQNKFIHEHPEAQFRIVRISLTDLNVRKEYERLVKIHGKDMDPRKNDHLRSDCERIARNYWKGARIESFLEASPQYKLSITQVK